MSYLNWMDSSRPRLISQHRPRNDWEWLLSNHDRRRFHEIMILLCGVRWRNRQAKTGFSVLLLPNHRVYRLVGRCCFSWKPQRQFQSNPLTTWVALWQVLAVGSLSSVDLASSCDHVNFMQSLQTCLYVDQYGEKTKILSKDGREEDIAFWLGY